MIEKRLVKFDDGRTGVEYSEVKDGQRTLLGMVVIRLANGRTTRVCYDRNPSLRDRIYSLTEIGNGIPGGAQWSPIEGPIPPDC